MKRERPKILVRGVNWLGDAIMTTPALARLRQAQPQAEITLLTAAKLADLWEGHPDVNKVISFSGKEGVGKIANQLRRERFDSALILPNSFRSALEVWMAGIPERVGYGGRGRGILLTQVVNRSGNQVAMRKRTPAEVEALVSREPGKPRDTYPASAHQIWHYLDLAAAMGASPEPLAARVAVSNVEKEDFRRKWDLPSGLIYGLNPGAEYGPAKRWPAERFIETAAMVSGNAACTWLIFGGLGDLAVAGRIEEALASRGRVVNLAGQTTLRELCAALSICRCVLTNDTGPMHLAAAVGTKVIVPFGSTSPELTGPVFQRPSPHSILLGAAPCAPCFLRECPIDFRCMTSITSEQAAAQFD